MVEKHMVSLVTSEMQKIRPQWRTATPPMEGLTLKGLKTSMLASMVTPELSYIAGVSVTL